MRRREASPQTDERGQRWLRAALLTVTTAGLLTAVLAGLSRLGWSVPVGGAHAIDHGPLLVFGVFSTLIGLERAVALGFWWAYAGPVASSLAAIAILLGYRTPTAGLALSGAVGLLLVNAAVIRRQSSASTWLMLLAAAVLACSAVAWGLRTPIFLIAPAWIAFFVLTIAAERLELSRFAAPSAWAVRLLVGAAILLACASTAVIWYGAPAVRLAGVALIAIAAWLLRFDLARRLIRQPALPRYMAAAVLSGAAWLGVAGLQLTLAGLPPAGPRYDAALHAVFIGFVLSMVMAHAPIILPAVAHVSLPFHPLFHVPLALLHVSLAVRIVADWSDLLQARRLAGLGNAASLVLFAVVVLIARARPSGGPTPRAPGFKLG